MRLRLQFTITKTSKYRISPGIDVAERYTKYIRFAQRKDNESSQTSKQKHPKRSLVVMVLNLNVSTVIRVKNVLFVFCSRCMFAAHYIFVCTLSDRCCFNLSNSTVYFVWPVNFRLSSVQCRARHKYDNIKRMLWFYVN